MILTQTTLSLDETRDVIAAIKSRFPNATTPPKDDICYATQNRQDAVKDLVGKRNPIAFGGGIKKQFQQPTFGGRGAAVRLQGLSDRSRGRN
jgi:hypothetical protein